MEQTASSLLTRDVIKLFMASVVPPYLPPPHGLNYLAAIEPCYTFVLISLPLAAILVPILLLIFFFSTPSSRRTLMFKVNVLIVLLGILECVLSTVVQSLIVLHPEHPPSDKLFLAYISFAFCTPIIVDCVLILRLSAVYPSKITPRFTRFSILTVPVLCTAARFACVSMVLRRWALLGQQSSALLASQAIWMQNPLIIADWSIQLFENMYCSTLFLSRLRGHKAFSSRMYRNQSVAVRLRALFYLAISNFVFPSIFSVAQLVYIVRDPFVVHGATILMMNNYISITFVVFSTIWCSSDVWKGSHTKPTSFGNDIRTAFPQSIITLTGIAPNLTLGTSESQPPPSHSLFARSHTTSHPLLHLPQPFVNLPHPDDKDGCDTESPANLARAMKSGQGSYMQTLALPGTNPDAHADDSTSEMPSQSPITPGDTRLDATATYDTRWNGVGPSTCKPGKNHCGKEEPSRATGEDEDSGMGVGIAFSFATATPPLPNQPSDRYWHRRRSLSEYGDSRDPYDPISHVRDRASLSEYADRHLRPAVDSDPPSLCPSFSHAYRPSFMDWSNAEPGGTRTSSSASRSLQGS